MRRRKLLVITSIIMAIYGIAIFIGYFLSIYIPDLYKIYKDMSILIIAVPAAYLAYSFQRRTEYMKTLKDLWYHMIDAVQMSIQYTFDQSPSHESYSEILFKLSIVIDEVRGSFKNVNEKKEQIGLYPFEPLKEIRREIINLSYQNLAINDQQNARKNIVQNWKKLRYSFLQEFDRDFPSYPNSKYLNQQEN